MNKQRVFLILLQLSVVVFAIGILSRIVHWPFAKELIIGSAISMMISTIFFYLSKEKYSFPDVIISTLIVFFCLNVLSRQLYIPSFYQSIIRVSLIVLAYFYFVYHAYKWYREDKLAGVKKVHLGRIGYVIGITLIAIGLIFKSQHFPYAKECLLTGLILSSLSFLFSMYLTESKDDFANGI